MYIVWNAGETSFPAGIITRIPPKLTPSAQTPVTEGLSLLAEPKSGPMVPMNMLGGTSPDSLFQLKLGHWKLLHYLEFSTSYFIQVVTPFSICHPPTWAHHVTSHCQLKR